jgi:hypothetical protein
LGQPVEDGGDGVGVDVLGGLVIGHGGWGGAGEEQVVVGFDDLDGDVGYRQHGIWLTRDELEQLIEGMRAAIVPVLSHEATPDRKRYLLSPIVFPVEDT